MRRDSKLNDNFDLSNEFSKYFHSNRLDNSDQSNDQHKNLHKNNMYKGKKNKINKTSDRYNQNLIDNDYYKSEQSIDSPNDKNYSPDLNTPDDDISLNISKRDR